ncbi:DEAD/DEAH box helicase [Pararhodospirillum oryzae]|uniref:DEAD/DEAH box helicase n=1 Tax=Pararhodospirillum oryzae TaxID=478448 RepID=A0A512H583_9PROT|nr:DEAD/DEAH box helicase [Pararhodospirillum oryzae]GEO80626.1 hypothetical protein ROR02_07570 [Pararhodospirillum oryzae]
MTDFAALGLAEPLLRAVAAEGYSEPTPIQAQAIPPLLEGADVLGIAQTGTGKTAAFVLPLLHRLATHTERPPRGFCRALILAPTRELASQINDCVRSYGRFLRVSSTVVVGGVRPGPQIRALNAGIDVVVATPGRLLDHVGAGVVRLEAVETVVLDEADHMLDLGFIPAIRRLMGRLPSTRQTVLLSATMPAPIRTLADDFLRDPREIAITPAARPIERIEQTVMMVESAAKRSVLTELLRENSEGRSIIFTRTKRGADRVADHLCAAGLPAEAIHGNKSQVQRERALASFRGDRVRILVATDIAARGIDVDGITFVYNYELPNVPEAYVHRIGRTARAGASGSAISLCDDTERPLLRDIERLIGRSLTGEADPEPRRRPRGSGRPAKGPGARPAPARDGEAATQGRPPRGHNATVSPRGVRDSFESRANGESRGTGEARGAGEARGGRDERDTRDNRGFRENNRGGRDNNRGPREARGTGGDRAPRAPGRGPSDQGNAEIRATREGGEAPVRRSRRPAPSQAEAQSGAGPRSAAPRDGSGGPKRSHNRPRRRSGASFSAA